MGFLLINKDIYAILTNKSFNYLFYSYLFYLNKKKYTKFQQDFNLSACATVFVYYRT